ncbi:MAG TPA: polysaccharide deacetylase family protein [candidate division Zixibacteria bacterium]|jgi:peptidoglycan/xylan/chitin deacetylase (PgdA/CDA1 family)
MEKIKDLAKSILYYSRYYNLVRFWRDLVHPEGKLIILSFHNISEASESLDASFQPLNLRPETTIRQFELQLRCLKKCCKVVSLEEGVNWMKKERVFRDKLAVITFDDSYESFYTLAFPLLKRYDFPATVFLPTDFINSQRIFWWDELQQIIFYAVPSGESASVLIPVIGEKLAKQFYEAGKDFKHKAQFLESLEFYLRSIEEELRQEKIEKLKELLLTDQHVKLAKPRNLSWDQITEMSRQGISFGSHTCSHLNLKFASLERVKEELAKSKEIIEDNIKAKVVSFAYPIEADFETHLRVRPILINLKYECACAGWRRVNLSNFDPFFLRRTTLPMSAWKSLIVRELLLC